MQIRRGASPGREVAEQIGVDPAVFYRLEKGTRGLRGQTAQLLARWLGWTTDQVLDALQQPPVDLEASDEPTLDPEPAPIAQDLTRCALRLPSGAVLRPWESFGGAGLRRPGVGMVVATTSESSATGGGLRYSERDPGRSVEERCQALDAWLVELGAVVVEQPAEPPTSAAS